MIKVWGRSNSANVQSVMWCIGEMQLAYERYDVGHGYGGTDTQEYYELNPNRLVPVIKDGDNPPLWESAAILRYLCHRYGKPPFWPESLVERTTIDMWAEWAKINIWPLFTMHIFFQLVRVPAAQRNMEAVATSARTLGEKLALAEQRLGQNDYLVGDVFSLADIQLGHILYRYYELEFERADLPNLRRYYEQLCQHPAYQEHVMVSFDSLRAD